MNYLLIALSLMIFRSFGYTHIGCYVDSSTRALAYGPQAYGYSTASCSEACYSYKYFAVQHGSWCSCSDDLDDATQYGESTGCGNSGTGGAWANDLYLNADKIYVGVSTMTDYYSAESACQDGVQLTLSGGQLATWGSDEEYEYIVEIRDDIGKDVWVGLNDLSQEGKWEFIDGDTSYCDNEDGTDCDDMEQWASGEPSDTGNQDVAEIKSDGLLYDIGVSHPNAFICEFDVKIEDYTVTAAKTQPQPQPQPNGGFYHNNYNHGNNKPDNNYYLFQISSIHIIAICSILLNIITITYICYHFYQKNNNTAIKYAKVNYDTQN